MPKKGGVHTPQETLFVQAYASHGDVQQAAKDAGFAAPHASGYKALARPAIQSEIIRIQTERLSNELLPLAINAIHNLLVNKATPAGAVVQAAKLVMDRTLGADDKGNSKEPHEMTGDELARQLDRLRKEASDRAKPIIEHQPTPGVFD